MWPVRYARFTPDDVRLLPFASERSSCSLTRRGGWPRHPSVCYPKHKRRGQPCLRPSHARDLPYEDGAFDLVVSINPVHNLYVFDLRRALQEIQRVGKGRGDIVVHSYRTDGEKANLPYWQAHLRLLLHAEGVEVAIQRSRLHRRIRVRLL